MKEIRFYLYGIDNYNYLFYLVTKRNFEYKAVCAKR